MKVSNVHERGLEADAHAVGRLIDSLASSDDALWPRRVWPPMRFDTPGLEMGARGGHGPIRYHVSDWRPGRAVAFRFERPRGFHGRHRLEVVPDRDGVVLRHVLEMRVSGVQRLLWPLVFRPLHDALIEDALAAAQAALGLAPRIVPWSPWVRLLRALATGGRAPPQSALFPEPWNP